jgi:hypothetical protein
VDGPLAPSAYSPTTYLLDHANITDHTAGPPRAFVYYADKGPLEAQRQRALGNPQSQPRVGLSVLVIVTGLLGCLYFLSRRLPQSGSRAETAE